ncbi:hypothetical protein [Rhodovulum sp. MB263]|uniref:hypothetical protein n=1 Tax=Rhodovulum sp. (strain MB263) TaxID=308754 RepID=UPI0009B72C43|nr:hypothetical protein [Rhodovulum sp. MB263]ARC90755.1 hypothetical protein B5V46_18940 [Rhodovulum sp. MB263]
MGHHAVLEVYLNGAPTILHASPGDLVFSFPATELLRDGANRLDVVYEPLDVEKRSYTPTPEVSVQIQLSQGRLGEATLLNARYGMEEERLVSEPLTLFSGRPSARSGQYLAAQTRGRAALHDLVRRRQALAGVHADRSGRVPDRRCAAGRCRLGRDRAARG